MELNVKEERKKTMTRREFVIKNYGKEVADDTIFCGIHGCPGHYPKLVALDLSCNAKRGIVTDREYTNQYILLTKADNKKGE